jgi:predicted ATPase/DNA-binding SARP family transcriptional activator
MTDHWRQYSRAGVIQRLSVCLLERLFVISFDHLLRMLDLRLLGQFEIRLDGRLVELPSRPAQALLAYLLLHPGAAHRRERLAGLLWPDSNESNARRNLRQALWQARRALDAASDTLIEADDLTITAHLTSEHRLDVALLDRPPDANESTADLTQRAEAYGGELLPGFYDDWAVLERERLQAQFERIIHALLDRLVAEARWPDVLHWGERWIAFGHTPESAYRALMIAHAAQGDTAAMADVYRRCVEALERDLGVEPSAQTRQLFEQLRRGEALPALVRPTSRVVETPRHNLPGQLTSFIGRTNEMAALKRLLTPPSGTPGTPDATLDGARLVTLTGPGGTGKTRLALQVAADVVDRFANGVWLVELALLSDPALLPQTVAAILGVREEPNYPLIRVLIEHLRTKSVLLILDNCEHLIEASAQFVEALLRACAQVKMLVTSRETLGVLGETVFRVPSLALPEGQTLPSVRDLAQYEAIRLFIERAATVKPEFRLSEANAAAVAKICRQLDGVPLAIELAAARVRSMTPEQIAARLDDRFRLLTGGSRTALPRQQTLRAMIDWSWDLLSEPERTLLRRLAVFIGGWTLEAAEAVCCDSGFEILDVREPQTSASSVESSNDFGLQAETVSDQNQKSKIRNSDVLELLTHLVEKSLVVVEEQRSEARYLLLDTIRQYAREKLLEAGESEHVRPRHLAFFLKLAEEAEPMLRCGDQLHWLARLDVEHDNLRAALHWAFGSGSWEEGLRLAGSLARFWYLRGYWNEGREWLKLLLAQSPSESPLPNPMARARARALAGAGWLADADGSEIPLYTESLALSRQVGDEWGEAYALRGVVVVNTNVDHLEHAEAHLQPSLALFRKLKDEWGIGLALFSLGWIAMNYDQVEEATARWAEALRHFRNCGDRWGISVALGALGYVARLQGNYAQAGALTHDSLALFRELGDKAGVSYSLIRLGNLAWRRGDYAEAIALLQESLELQRERSNQEGIIAALQGQALAAAFQGHYEQAKQLLDESAVLAHARAVPDEIGDNLDFLALTFYFQNQLERAESLFAQSLAVSQQANETEGIAFSTFGLGLVAQQRGQYAAAAAYINESLRLWEMRGHKHHIAAAHNALGRMALAQKDGTEAINHFRASLALYREMVDKRGTAIALEGIGAALDQADLSARLVGAAHAIRQAIGAPIPPVEQQAYSEQIERTRCALGAGAFDAAWAAGQRLTTEQAISLALGQDRSAGAA